jgi:AraC-like DNA-binding protein
MPSSSVHTYTEPDEYAAAGHHSSTRLLAIKRHAQFSAKFTAVDLVDVRINQFLDTLPRIARLTVIGDRILFGFQARPGAGPNTNGIEAEWDKLYQTRANGQEFYRQTYDATALVTVSLPPGLVHACEGLSGHVPMHNDIGRHAPPVGALEKLRCLSNAAASLAENAPGVLASLEAARGLEQAIISALIECVDGGRTEEDRSAVRQHAAVMRRFYTVIDERAEQPLYIPELCKAVGVSERTLRTCCEEHLGMGPKHYLLLRRMNLARQALLHADPAETNVTAIATDHGFWELGRFSAEYRALFGESPSEALWRPRRQRSRGSGRAEPKLPNLHSRGSGPLFS